MQPWSMFVWKPWISKELCFPSSSYSCPCGYPSRAEAGTTQVTFTSFL